MSRDNRVMVIEVRVMMMMMMMKRRKRMMIRKVMMMTIIRRMMMMAIVPLSFMSSIHSSMLSLYSINLPT